MRLAVSELALEHRASRVHACVTISVGVAVIEPTRERRSRGAFQLADQALYEAKQRGRNRVELMDQSAHGQLVTGIFSKISAASRQ
jgi:diguanylate cyclase (GGDEF)-like protein